MLRNKKEVAPREEGESFLSARDQHADDDSDGACVRARRWRARPQRRRRPTTT